MENGIRRKLAQEVAEFYESQGAVFSSKRSWPWDLMSLFKDRLKPGDLLVDVGAGNGRLADTLPPNVRYLGLEPSSSLRAASECDLRPGELPHLDLPGDSADAVACIAVLHHIPSKELRQE